MKRWLLVALTACCLAAAVPNHPLVSRGALRAVEIFLDNKLIQEMPDGRIELIGNTRGVYLEKYGAVFTIEVNLWEKAVVSPFHPKWTKEEIAVARKKKLERLPVLRQDLREALFMSASTIDTLPPNELVVVCANIDFFSWEDAAGMPTQIVMRAPKHSLLDLSMNRGDKQKLEADIQVQEY
jgi:hypothetical protein